MTTETRARPGLPQGVGDLSRAWWIFIGVDLLVVAFGVYAFAREVSIGMIETGQRDVGTMGGAAWGLYISMVVYFIGVSFAGITVAALIRIFNLERLRSLARMAELLTVVSLVLGALAIIVDLGQPLRGIINLFRYARPESPFFGTFTLVLSGYLFASLVYLFLDGRRDAAIMARFPGRLQWYHRWWASGYQDTPEEKARHRTSTLWLALAIVPLLIVAHSTLGFVFGLQVGRPGWYGTLQAPAFVALAGVSGVGNLIILAALVRRIFRKWNGDRIAIDAFAWMGKSLMALLAVYLYFMAVELLTLVYATPEAEKQLSDALLRGEYAWIYWGSVAALFLPMIAIAYQTLKKKWSVGLLVAVGVLVNLGAIGKRYLIVVPSQTHGELLPYEIGSYSPTWTEYAVVLGLFALGALLIGLFMKAFPILPIEEGKEVGADA